MLKLKLVLSSRRNSFIHFVLLSLILLFLHESGNEAQTRRKQTIVRGVVVDSVTNEPLSFVSISFSPLFKTGAVTDDEGQFRIVSGDSVDAIRVSILGYQTVLFPVDQGKSQYVNIKLHPAAEQLNAVEIVSRRRRYRNKDNPAVALIQRVIENKDKNRPENSDYLQYQRYQKTVFSFDNVKDALKNNKLLQPFRFVFENVDTTIVPKRQLIPVFLKETNSDFYFRKKPYFTKELIEGEKIVRFDEYVNRRSVSESLNYLYQDINIYDNNINFLTNQFLSPIATLAPTFYKFFIKDTSLVEGIKCIRLNFEPRNKTDLLFQGDMYITMDSSYAVKKIDMTVNKSINLNWVRSISIVQEFEKADTAGWRLSVDQIGGDFGITQGSVGIYGQRICSYSHYKTDYNAGDTVYRGLAQVYLPNSESHNEDYWQEHRRPPLRKSEQNIYVLMDSLKHVRQFRNDMLVINTIGADFIKAGWVEFGPFSTFYSYNPVEGSRVKFGGRTTPLFSKKIFFDGYMAYGAKDEAFKSEFGINYSLTNRTIYQFPVKSIKASYQYDTEIPGQSLSFAQPDNFLLSIKRGTNDKMYYNRTYRLEHLNEFTNHFSYDVAYTYSSRIPAGNLYFNNVNYAQYINTIRNIDVSQMSLLLRYAPHERFFQGSLYRTPFTNKYPVIQLQFAASSKLIGSSYNFQTLDMDISKRFYLSVLGYTDVTLEGGKVFGRVPYPLLDIHRANQTYSYQASSYNLMNFLEFVSDEYAAINIDHNFNGFFFNKIPLFKKLNFRELLTFKALYGGLSKTNNPAYHPDLFQFPTDNLGVPLTYTLEKMPYMEAGVGVSNIFRFLRIEYVQRLTYLNHPDISKSGIRLGFKFDF